MKKFLSGAITLLFVMHLQAQNIVAAEYFFNSDPGVGAGNPISINSPATMITFTTSIPTAALSTGFHSLAIRTRDAAGLWSLSESRPLYISANTSNSASLTAAEYFIDNDPGPGNGTPVSIGATGNTVSFTALIPAAALSNGFHNLAIRVKDANEVWSLFESRPFYIATTLANAGAITSAEYFFDNDPGPGNGQPLPVGISGNSVNFISAIPTSSLSPGFHALAIRVKNSEGNWSLFETRPMYISTTTGDMTGVTRAEYFIDNDPGVDNGLPITVSTNGNIVSFLATVPSATLATGFHILAIRVQDANGNWSLLETRPFYISPIATNMGNIVAAEYFIDSDPGVGNGSPLSFNNPGPTVNQTFSLPLPPGTTTGAHTFVMRVQDANGIWSLFDTAIIYSTLPVDWLSFYGKRMQDKIALEWQTENEVNASHFEVERSRNGIEFSSLGKVGALGRQQNSYRFDDVQPFKGLNFYRLKQLDKDGRFKYSVIVKVFFGDESRKDLQLFPQPASSFLNVVFGGTGSQLFIQVYDAGGKVVMNERRQQSSTFTVETSTLATGSYWIVVSDGITQQSGRFVKQ